MTQAPPHGQDVAKAARVATSVEVGGNMVFSEIVDALEDAPGPRFVEEDTVELKGLRGERRMWTVRRTSGPVRAARTGRSEP